MKLRREDVTKSPWDVMYAFTMTIFLLFVYNQIFEKIFHKKAQ